MPWTFFRCSAFYNFKPHSAPARTNANSLELVRKKKDFCPGLVLAGPSFGMFKKAFLSLSPVACLDLRD